MSFKVIATNSSAIFLSLRIILNTPITTSILLNSQLTFTCSKSTIKTPEGRQGRRSSVFIVSFEHISHFLVFLLLTWDK